MNLLFAVKGDFLKQAFEKPKRYSSFSRDYVWEHICCGAWHHDNRDVYWGKR